MQSLPPEIMTMVAHYLGHVDFDGSIITNYDLLRLRTVSRDMYSKTLEEFKIEHFRTLTLYTCSEEDQHRTSTMLKYAGFKAAVQQLIVEDFARLPLDMTILSEYDLLRSQLTGMHNLREVMIAGQSKFDSFIQRSDPKCNEATQAFLAALVATSSPIESITINACVISQGALSVCLRAKASTLREVTLTNMLCYDGDWSPLLRTIRDDLRLTHVHTNELCGHKDWDKALSCDTAVVRALKDKDTGKIGHYRCRTQAAWMYDEAAVNAGCDKLLSLPYHERDMFV